MKFLDYSYPCHITG